jgi:hypothetical protein
LAQFALEFAVDLDASLGTGHQFTQELELRRHRDDGLGFFFAGDVMGKQVVRKHIRLVERDLELHPLVAALALGRVHRE